MRKKESLKGENRKVLWPIIAANLVLLYLVIEYQSVAVGGAKALVASSASLLPAGLALVISVVANGLVSSDLKAKLVFLRWRHVLPGHRAFSEHMPRDPRIDAQRLKKACGNKIPDDPEEQNRLWYRLFKSVENLPSVAQVHKDFLLTRDYTGLAFICFVVFGATALFEVANKHVAVGYLVFLLGQVVVARQAAATYGARFVRTVLAEKSAERAK